jgi:hypothetical protein
MLHIKITHFNDDYCRHYKCRNCLFLARSVASVADIIQSSFPCCVSNDITRTLETPSKTGLTRINHLIMSSNNFPWKKPLKNDFWKASLPYPLSGSVSTP